VSGQPLKAALKGGAMSEQEKERTHAASDDPEVEAHKTKGYGDEGSDREGAERRETDDGSDDVEAHRFKNA
jgi:hypothetical protein